MPPETTTTPGTVDDPNNPPAGEDGDDGDGIEGLDDGPPGGREKMVPLSRLQELVHDRDEERKMRQLSEQRLSDVLGRLSQQPPDTNRPPDASRFAGVDVPDAIKKDPIATAYYHIEQGIRRFLPDALKAHGVSVESLKDVGLKLPRLEQSTFMTEWNAICKEHELDPESRVVRSAFLGMVSGENAMKPEEAIVEIKKSFPKKTLPKRATGIISGSTNSPTTERVTVRDRAHAAELARAGKIAEPVGIFDALAQQKKLRGAR